MFYKKEIIGALFVLFMGSFVMASEPRPLLGTEYTNYAWGFHNNGCFLNEKGEIYRWQRKASDKEKELEKSDKIANEKQLQEIKEKLLQAEKGAVSFPEHRMADAGIHTYHGYIYGSKEGAKDVKVTLGQDGDFVVTNSSPAAGKLIKAIQELCTKSEKKEK